MPCSAPLSGSRAGRWSNGWRPAGSPAAAARHQLTVDPGWERAVKRVLGAYLEPYASTRSTTSRGC
jgi:hypothetical protein